MIALNNLQKILELNFPLYSPYQVDDVLYVASENGEILKFSDGQLKTQFKCNGQPSSIAFDSQKNTFYIGDLANQAILAYTVGDTQTAELVKQYEGVPLLGPHSIVLSKKTGNVIFTDSGPLGQTSLQNTKGSVFMIDMQQQNIKPLALRCLSIPTGIAFSEDERILYVCETGKNRLLRFFESSQGIYYSSVFYQFSGRYGPSAVTVTTSNIIFVALYEFRNISSEGVIAVLNNQGEQLAKLKLSHTGPEITGLFFSRISNNNAILYMTQNSSKPSCLRLLVEVTKKEEKNKNVSYTDLLK